MKQASQALIRLLLNNQVFYTADLYTITLSDKTVLRYTNCDVPLMVDGNRYQILSIARTGTTQTRGIDVDELTLTIDTDKKDKLPGGLTLMQGIAAGSFEHAMLRLDRVFNPSPFAINTPKIDKDYVLLWWIGLLNIDEAGGLSVSATASSMTQLLNNKFPRNLYYPPCIHTLGGTDCKVDLTKHQASGKLAIGSTRLKLITNLTAANGAFSQGSIRFTSGANTNVTRTVKTYENGELMVILPFTNLPAKGDTFIVYPACNKTMDVCKNVFHNLEHYRGYPFIPVPETAY